MRVALSRLCSGGPFSRFQAVPRWTPAAICRNCGLPPIASPSPRGRPYVLVSVCKVTFIFFNCKKNLKKYLISLIIKHLQRGIFAVKRFNSRVPVFGWLPGSPVAVASSAPTRAHVCRQAGRNGHRHTHKLIKTFYFRVGESGRYLCITANQIGKNKTF